MEIKRTFLPGDEWLFLKLYTGRVFSDQLLGEILYPLLESLAKMYKVKTWFFIRYEDPQNHIRLRIKSNDYDSLLKEINQNLEPFLNKGVLWNIEIGTYKREIERYNSVNIEICEQLFTNESKLIIFLLNQKLKTNEFMILSLSIIGFYIDLLIDEPKDRIPFLSSNYLAFKSEFAVRKLQLKELNRKYNEINNALDSINLFDYAKKMPSLRDYIDKQRKLVNYLSKKERIADSLIHMLVNRLFHSNPRTMELVMYHHLEKYYKTKKAKAERLLEI